MNRKKRFIFIVQGEGRGHMTQAISLYNILKDHHQEVQAILIGKSHLRQIPDFFREAFDCPVIEFNSPNFIKDKNNKSIRLFKTIWVNMFKIPRYIREIRLISQLVKRKKTDVVVNFYDIVGGFYYLTNPGVKRISLAHQFLSKTPEYKLVPGTPVQKLLFKTNNWLTGMNSHKYLALSLRREDKRFGKTVITPPLIRKEVLSLEPKQQDHILAYLVNPGYGADIEAWHKNHQEVELHLFWDNKDYPSVYSPHANLTFHHLDGMKFLEYMQSCKGYVTTAGFESVCEAMYLNKPVLMVPVQNQYEQKCNAADAVLSGAGISDERFDLDRLLDYLPNHPDHSGSFREWVAMGDAIFVRNLRSKPFFRKFQLPWQ